MKTTRIRRARGRPKTSDGGCVRCTEGKRHGRTHLNEEDVDGGFEANRVIANEFARWGEVGVVGMRRLHGGRLGRSVATKLEAGAVAALIKAAGGSVTLLLGEESTIGQLENAVEGKRFVHVATHGLSGSREKPYDASLALTRPQAPIPDDIGFLTLDYLISCWRGKLTGCELVVLKRRVYVANMDSDYISFLLNNGDGTFAAPVAYGAGDGPACVAIGDLDGVNGPDLAVANRGSDNVSVLLNNGDGTFTAVDYAVGDEPVSVAMADLNGGWIDIAVGNHGSDDVSILLNNGDGSFAAAVEYAAGDGPVCVAMGDLNGDGWIDVAVANWNSDDVSILLSLCGVCPGDLDCDGDVDLTDLATLLANYGTTGGATYEDGDLDADGDVDLTDLAQLLAVYGTECDE